MPIQNDWWWCNKCQGLTFGGELSPGQCQAGGQHDHSGSGEYTLVRDDAAAPGQANWRRCTKCQALIFAGNPAPGLCPAGPPGSPHDPSRSGNYALVHDDATAPGQANWRRCSKCQGLAFAGNHALGPCPSGPPGSPHDHTNSRNYAIPVQDRSEPIDQAIGRHLLTAFGPCNDAAQARATLAAACSALVAKGGGVIVIPTACPAIFSRATRFRMSPAKQAF